MGGKVFALVFVKKKRKKRKKKKKDFLTDESRQRTGMAMSSILQTGD